MNTLNNQPILTQEQKEIVLEIFEWVKRMSDKYGPTINSIQGTTYDWGQALCREQFGVDWHCYMINNEIQLPTKEDLNRALDWENGNIPKWVNQPI